MNERAASAVLLWLCFFTFLEGFSWVSASWPSPCLIEKPHENETADNNRQKDCPAFVAGLRIGAQRAVDWVKHDDNDKAIVAAFTIVLAISTIGLWFATTGLQRSTKKLWEAGERHIDVAVRAADAANLTAKAVIGMELPVLVVETPDLGGVADKCRNDGIQVSRRELAKFCKILHLKIGNAGRTPAFATEIGIGYSIADEIADSPLYTWKRRCAATEAIRPDKTMVYDCTTFCIEVTDEQTSRLKADEFGLWLYAYISYSDFLGDHHENRFFWIWAQNPASLKYDFVAPVNAPAEYVRKK